jgi:hypothetical protein
MIRGAIFFPRMGEKGEVLENSGMRGRRANIQDTDKSGQTENISTHSVAGGAYADH